MNAKLKYALENFVSHRQDLFGKNSVFVSFKNENTEYGEVNDLFATTLFGRIIYHDDGKLLSSESLAIKLVRENDAFEFYEMTAAANEVFFYTKILPFFDKHRAINHLFPRYLSNLAQTNNNAIENVTIMENLKASGYIHAKAPRILDYEHLCLMMRKLGEFHAYSYHIKESDPLRFACLAKSLGNNLNKLASSCLPITPQLLQPIGKTLLQESQYWSKPLNNQDELFELCRKLLLEGLEDDVNDSTSIISHGDFNARNFMFKHVNGEVVDGKIIDMGNCFLRTPALDLGYPLLVNTDQKMRDERWHDLIDIYYAALCQTFPDTKVPTKESIIAGLPKKLIFVAYIAVIAYSVAEGIRENNTNKFELQNLSLEHAMEIVKDTDLDSRAEIFKEVLKRNGFGKQS